VGKSTRAQICALAENLPIAEWSDEETGGGIMFSGQQ
jgi:hypothetical protein